MRSGRLLFSKVGEAGVNETFFMAAAEEVCIGARFCASEDSATDSREMKTEKSARKTASADLIFTMTLLAASTSRLFLVDILEESRMPQERHVKLSELPCSLYQEKRSRRRRQIQMTNIGIRSGPTSGRFVCASGKAS
jgi:hypothetical protein